LQEPATSIFRAKNLPGEETAVLITGKNGWEGALVPYLREPTGIRETVKRILALKWATSKDKANGGKIVMSEPVAALEGPHDEESKIR
jgi:hypothetical protein